VAVHALIAEPRRGEHDAPTPAVLTHTVPPHAAPEVVAKAGFVSTILRFFGNPILLLASVASGAANFITYGTSNFAILLLMREKGMQLSDVAIWYALVVGMCMGGGIFVSGRLIDRYGVRSKVAYALIPAISLVVALPFFICFASAAQWQTALLFFCVPMFLNSFFLSAMVTFVQSEVHPDQRVISGALLLLVMNFIGLGLGPTYVGMASDYFRSSHGTHSLQFAFFALAPMYLIAALLFAALARRIYRTNPPR
jgi:MFS family permease